MIEILCAKHGHMARIQCVEYPNGWGFTCVRCNASAFIPKKRLKGVKQVTIKEDGTYLCEK